MSKSSVFTMSTTNLYFYKFYLFVGAKIEIIGDLLTCYFQLITNFTRNIQKKSAT